MKHIEDINQKHYDFFADIFEYLIKDYNTAGGGKYAEYYTPHAIATIMAKTLFLCLMILILRITQRKYSLCSQARKSL